MFNPAVIGDVKSSQRGPSHIHSKTIDCTPPHTLHHNGKRSLETHKGINIRTVPKTKPSELTTCVRVDSVRSPHKRLPRFSTVIKGGHKLLKHDCCLLRIELKEDLVHKLISGIIILPYILFRGGFSFTYFASRWPFAKLKTAKTKCSMSGNKAHIPIRENKNREKFGKLTFVYLCEIKYLQNTRRIRYYSLVHKHSFYK